jgi:NhaA family Na+:H+ antiporter
MMHQTLYKGIDVVVHKKIFDHFINKEALSGFLLFGATLLAVIFANLESTGQLYYDIWHMPLGIKLGELTIAMNLNMWINDGLMALFFLMVGLEIKRELLIGELSSVQKASFPVVAAIGGMVIPALVYVGFNPSNPMGFGVPMATDIAFALGILLLLGNKVSPALKLFLVALAVVDDLGAVMVVATVYTNELHLEYLLHFAFVYALIWILNIKGVKSLLPYLILGVFLWIYIHAIGIHATIAGVLLALAIPIKSQIEERVFINNARHNIDEFEKHIDEIPLLNESQIDALEHIAHGYDKVQNPLVKLEHTLHGFSAFVIMPLFAFANAGVVIDMSGVNQHLMIVLGVIFGLVIGKPIGIVGFTYFASKMKWVKKPLDLTWREVVAVGFLGGIGFTMSIFITHLAFLDESIISAVKLGIFIASFIAAIIGVVLINMAHKKKTNG